MVCVEISCPASLFVSLEVVKIVIFTFKADVSEPYELMKQSMLRNCSNHLWQFRQGSAVGTIAPGTRFVNVTCTACVLLL